MEKQIIYVPRREEPFKCGQCGRMVDIRHAKAKVTETDDIITHGWDYGHEHKTTFQFINGRAYSMEGSPE